MKTLIRRTLHLMRVGWGNGYVLIPPTHPLHGVDYWDINVDVHGGLTYSQLVTEKKVNHWVELDAEDIGKWCVGFDTCHFHDTLKDWPKERVQEETEKLKKQLIAYIK